MDFLHKISENYNVRDPASWYRVSSKDVSVKGGSGLLRHYDYDGLPLHLVYPHYKWKRAGVPLMRKTRQVQLLTCVRSLLPFTQVEEEHQVGSRDLSGVAVSVDIFVPEFNLALEYQGELHYHTVLFHTMPLPIFEARDAEKKSHCEKSGITLVPIPYWWIEGDVESLAATILHYKPDMKPHMRVKGSASPLLDVKMLQDAQQDHVMSPNTVRVNV